MKARTFFTALAVVAITGGVIAHHRKSGVNHEVRNLVHLNEVLTNEMSDTSTLAGLDKSFESFMRQWSIKGASLSIMKNDSLVYAKGYGMADKDEPMGPGTIMRVASVSKLITATAIMVLQEKGLLSIDDKVFAPGGLLDCYADEIKDRRYFDITIKNLLMHEGGFSTRGGDPMFSTLNLIRANKWEKAPDTDLLIRTMIRRKLGSAPGNGSHYSNFGYLLLSVIVERASGQDYEQWTRENVLIPAGCFDMHIGGSFYEDRLDGETRYYVQDNQPEVECFDGSGRMVERCYGGSNIKALKGAGGWVTSTPELARFVASIDGKKAVPDIISPESVKQMTFCTDKDTYALGWSDITRDGTWTRTGTLSSTSALIKYYPNGECWIFVTNTGTWRGPHFTKWTSTQFRKLREKYSSKLPERDFFSL